MCFGAITTQAVILSSNELKCIVPASKKPGLVSTSVTMNGNDWSIEDLQYRYLSKITVFDVQPFDIPISGGVPINISGMNFELSGAGYCSFGDVLRTLTIISKTLSMCMASSTLKVGKIDFDIFIYTEIHLWIMK